MNEELNEPVEEVIEGNLGRSTTLMATGTAISRVTGFVRLYAMFFAFAGVGAMSDAYVLANSLPNIIYEIVLGGVLSATLVPVFMTTYSAETKEERQGIQAVFGVIIAIGLLVSAIFIVAAPLIIDAYGSSSNNPHTQQMQHEVATYLLRWFSPQIFFYGIISFATAVLNSKRKFAAPMFAPILNNVVVISMFLILGITMSSHSLTAYHNNQTALLFLGAFTTLGVVAMAIALIPSLRTTGLSLRPIWQPKHPAVKSIALLSGWTFGFVIANQVALFIVLRLAHTQTGGVSAYTTAFVFFLLPHGIFAVSIISALHTELSDSWNTKNLLAYKSQVSRGIRLILAIMVPAAIGYATLSTPIVRVLLPHSVSSGDSAHLVDGTLALMAIGLPAFSLYLFFTRCFQAMHDTRTAFWLYIVENGVNILIALAVYSWAGVHGLAIALSIAYIIGAACGYFVLARRVGGLNTAEIGSTFGKVMIASIFMASAIVIVRLINGILGTRALVQLITCIPAGLATYLLMAHVERMTELSLVLRGPLKRFAPKESQNKL